MSRAGAGKTLSDGRYNLVRGFHQRLVEQPQAPALWVDDRRYSYAELGRRAGRIAGWLRAAGLGPGSRVGVLGGRHALSYAGILGACWAGAAYVPLNPRNPEARLRGLLERAEPHALIIDDSAAASLSPALLETCPRHLLASDRRAAAVGPRLRGESTLEPPTGEPPVALGQEDLAYLMFTSGTTGVPKGVMVSAANVERFMTCMQERYRIGPDDRLSQFFELTFDLSVFDLFMGWSGGACVYVIPESERMSPTAFVRRHQLTVWFSVPSAVAFMLRVKTLAPGLLPSLRLSLFCGEPLPERCARRWGEAAPQSEVENLYGPTEATIACLLEPCGERMVVTPHRETVSIGRPYAGMQAAIVGDEGAFIDDASSGELALTGSQVAPGYWRDPQLTAQRFPVLDHPQLGRRRFYLTGDLAYRDAEGRFHHLGRIDNQVKIHGHRVELEEIDAQLRRACGHDAAAVAWPVRHGSADGAVAFVTGDAPVAAIREALKQALPAYMVPRRIVHLESLPLTLNGKIDRSALIAMLQH